ncbi:MAG: hypothetical protein IJV64_05450, partial [Oscillospiraceae bacterium]|nr:hypothetical protein [Oscillospiraceae bacterium]
DSAPAGAGSFSHEGKGTKSSPKPAVLESLFSGQLSDSPDVAFLVYDALFSIAELTLQCAACPAAWAFWNLKCIPRSLG